MTMESSPIYYCYCDGMAYPINPVRVTSAGEVKK